MTAACTVGALVTTQTSASRENNRDTRSDLSALGVMEYILPNDHTRRKPGVISLLRLLNDYRPADRAICEIRFWMPVRASAMEASVEEESDSELERSVCKVVST